MATDLLQQKGLFEKQLIHHKVSIPFVKIGANLEEEFLNYAEKKILNQCEKEGYIFNNDHKVVSYSAGKTLQSNIEYNVLYEFQVCYPHENMIFQCMIQNITKIGIKAILSHNEIENPIIVFASQLHNPTIFENDNNSKYNEGDIIQVKVISYRFEIHDPSIYVLAEII